MALAIVLLAAVSGCGRGDATGSDAGLTPAEFAAVMVELREAEWEALESDSAAAVFARRKEEILERHGTSAEELRAFVEDASRDIQSMAAIWEEISRRLRRPGAAERPR